MNKITSVERFQDGLERTSKTFEIILPENKGLILLKNGKTEFDGGNAVVIPPLVRYTVTGCGGLRIVIEKAILPFREVKIIADGKDGGIAFAAEQAEHYFYSGVAKSSLIVSALGELLVSYVSVFSARSGFSPVVDTVLAEIAKGVSDSSFSLEDRLRKLPLNYDYIRKLFKKEVGVTPHEHLLSQRMKLARTLILGGMANRYSNYTVAQIAEACGFSEPLYFSRVFKKYFGVAPSEYK